jgi:hypothetical protein
VVLRLLQPEYLPVWQVRQKPRHSFGLLQPVHCTDNPAEAHHHQWLDQVPHASAHKVKQPLLDLAVVARQINGGKAHPMALDHDGLIDMAIDRRVEQ